MAFGQDKNNLTVVPSRKTSQPIVKPSVGAFTPNPKIARLYSSFMSLGYGKELTQSQLKFIKTFFTGYNVLLTGEAGTGKSHVVKALFAYLDKIGVSIGKTGLTGVAAFNIGGQTLHSFMGIGLGQESADVLISKIFKNRKVWKRIRAVEVLFIDEISMCKGELLDKIDKILRHYRHPKEPFGGVQIIGCGDWLQLPPIFKDSTSNEFAFQCSSWREACVKTVVLKEQMRQHGDPTFAGVLGGLRVGDTSKLHLLHSRINATFPKDGIEPVRIFCKNFDVDRHNKEQLDKLTTPSKIYTARDHGAPHFIESLEKNCPAPKVLELKIGAQVILLSNLDVEKGFVNGSIGTVQSYASTGVRVQFKTGTIIVEEEEWQIKDQEADSQGKIQSRVVATRTQIPLKLCWAITVHRAQGKTLDRAVVDVEEAFSTGMCYTALSRVRNMESLSISGSIPHEAIQVNLSCVEFYERAEEEETEFRF
jgi:ATP-dependent exoDNAse (exonuclease V) alpha subunit